jgi:MYXO-CTERM domain-containing protein
VLLAAAPVHAHFRLDYPAANRAQDSIGNAPDQMGVVAENISAPCGDSKIPTNTVTAFRPGAKVVIRWLEPYKRDGHYRISFAANRADLKSPTVMKDAKSIATGAAIETGGAILMDGVHPHLGKDTPEYKKWEQEVTLPNYVCDRCTLQLIEFQNNHPWPYLMYHCADIILSETAPEGGMVIKNADGGVSDGPIVRDAAAATSKTDVAAVAQPDAGPPGSSAAPDAAAPAGTEVPGGSSMPGPVATGGKESPPSGSLAPPSPMPGPAATAPPSTEQTSAGGCSTAGGNGSCVGVWTLIAALALALRRRRR